MTHHQLVTGGNPDAPADIPDGKLFDDNEAEYLEAPELAALGRALVAHYPEELGHLLTATIRFVWKKKGTKDCGKPVLGTCSRPGALARFFAGCDYVVTLHADHCTAYALTAWQLEALVFHELLHADVDVETAKPAIRGHDCELFHDELRHYGLWTVDLREARIAFEQVPLPMYGKSAKAA